MPSGSSRINSSSDPGRCVGLTTPTTPRQLVKTINSFQSFQGFQPFHSFQRIRIQPLELLKSLERPEPFCYLKICGNFALSCWRTFCGTSTTLGNSPLSFRL